MSLNKDKNMIGRTWILYPNFVHALKVLEQDIMVSWVILLRVTSQSQTLFYYSVILGDETTVFPL